MCGRVEVSYLSLAVSREMNSFSVGGIVTIAREGAVTHERAISLTEVSSRKDRSSVLIDTQSHKRNTL